MSNGTLADDGVVTLSGVVVSTLVLTSVTTRQLLFTVGRTLEVERRNTAWYQLYVTTAGQTSSLRLKKQSTDSNDHSLPIKKYM